MQALKKFTQQYQRQKEKREAENNLSADAPQLNSKPCCTTSPSVLRSSVAAESQSLTYYDDAPLLRVKQEFPDIEESSFALNSSTAPARPVVVKRELCLDTDGEVVHPLQRDDESNRETIEASDSEDSDDEEEYSIRFGKSSNPPAPPHKRPVPQVSSSTPSDALLTSRHTSESSRESSRRMSALQIRHSFPFYDLERSGEEMEEELRREVREQFAANNLHARQHQCDAVAKILHSIMKWQYEEDNLHIFTNLVSGVEGNGKLNLTNYLIQHSPGSGKTLTMSSLAYSLVRLRKYQSSNSSQQLQQSQSYEPIFSKILIVSDRKVLDRQLTVTAYTFFQSLSLSFPIVCHAGSVQELRDLICNPATRVILTTIQKFSSFFDSEGQIVDKSLQKAMRVNSRQNQDGKIQSRIGIIADEAHRSHGSSQTRYLHEILTGHSFQTSRLCYFSFTSTPSARTLEMFGRKSKDKQFLEPFHTYSLRKAIKDKVVLDVLQDYTCVTLTARIDHDRTTLAARRVYQQGDLSLRQLHRITDADDGVVRSKAKYILSHFLERIWKRGSTSNCFLPKGMLVTSSRKKAVIYKIIMDELLLEVEEERKVKACVSFTPLQIGDHLVTEAELNHIDYDPCTEDYFRSNKDPHDVRLIIVADKLQTGFDCHDLNTLYVDKHLQGSSCVQTLGRLNRVSEGKTSVCIVDFANDADAIAKSFAEYMDKCVVRDSLKEDALTSQFENTVEALLLCSCIHSYGELTKILMGSSAEAR